jgi:hypothetical protein
MSGSKTEAVALRWDVCFAPVSGHRQVLSTRPESADFVAEIRMQTARDGWCHF